jgi:D-proline reductase (dithiol) PrdB
MSPQRAEESFESFRKSFSYGRRNDLNFKFFKGLSDDEVAAFLQDLLYHLGDAYDTGDIQPLIDAAYKAQVAGYSPSPEAASPSFAKDDGPFTPTRIPITEAKIGMLTTSGHFVEGDDPKPFGVTAMTQDEAVKRIGEFMKDTPTLSEIPASTATSDLRVRHGGYDIRSALRDPNVTFPIDRLREAYEEGLIGDLAETFFSFPGATSQGRLRSELPGWIERIHEEDIDVMLLVPV